jgi:hypothetical protein
MVFRYPFAMPFEVSIVVAAYYQVEVQPKPVDATVKPAQSPYRPAEHGQTCFMHTSRPSFNIATPIQDDLSIGIVRHEFLSKDVRWSIRDCLTGGKDRFEIHRFA